MCVCVHACACVHVCVCSSECYMYSFLHLCSLPPFHPPLLPPSLPPQLQFHVSVLRALHPLLIHSHFLVSPVICTHTYTPSHCEKLYVHCAEDGYQPETVALLTLSMFTHVHYYYHPLFLSIFQTHSPLYCSSLTWSLPLGRQWRSSNPSLPSGRRSGSTWTLTPLVTPST